MKKIFLLLLLILIAGCTQTTFDSNYFSNTDLILQSIGHDKEEFIKQFKEEIKTDDKWALGDTYLVLARLTNNTEFYKKSCEHFLEFKPKNSEEKALLFETLSSLNCNNKKKTYLRKAITEWEKTGVAWRSKILKSILDDKNTKNLKFDTTEISPKINLTNYNKIIIGKTTLKITKNDTLIAQVDRVYRDWLGKQLNQNPFAGNVLSVFSERLKLNKSELREDIGWHEGGRIKDIQNTIGITTETAVGTIVAKHEEKWYAPDENGIFRFEVPPDKVYYPTTRFLTENIGVVIDTHGINVLVEQSLRKNASVVIGCCDSPAKTKAAVYLSEKGKKIICFTDLFLFNALGYEVNIVGSPVFYEENEKIVFGNSPVVIEKNQKIAVSNANTGKTYAIWYYSAPYLYFSEINKTFPLDIVSISFDDFNQSKLLFDKAREVNASIVASRIFNFNDYEQAKKWLSENKNNTLILFHSTSYPAGILMMNEFKEQVSFNDLNVKGII